jgi:hypothetical protein
MTWWQGCTDWPPVYWVSYDLWRKSWWILTKSLYGCRRTYGRSTTCSTDIYESGFARICSNCIDYCHSEWLGSQGKWCHSYISDIANDERAWTILGAEFGSDSGKKASIVQALFGLKSADTSFGWHLADCMQLLGYSLCKADPDVWGDNLSWRQLLVLCILSVVCWWCSLHPSWCRESDLLLGQVFSYESWIDWRSRYLLGNETLSSWIDKWSICLVHESNRDAVHNVKLSKNGQQQLPTWCSAPWLHEYVSKLDETPELLPELATTLSCWSVFFTGWLRSDKSIW